MFEDIICSKRPFSVSSVGYEITLICNDKKNEYYSTSVVMAEYKK